MPLREKPKILTFFCPESRILPLSLNLSTVRDEDLNNVIHTSKILISWNVAFHHESRCQ